MHKDTGVQHGFLREHDPDRYLTALFALKRARPALMALYTFNMELSRIPDLASEPVLGEIRLQWWRDALANMARGNATGAPVADALMAVMAGHDLPVHRLQGMIDARCADLDGGGFKDMQALSAYLFKSEGAVFALSARILGGKTDEMERAVNEAGFACGLSRILCLLPHDLARGRVMLPLSMLKANGVEPEQLLAGEAVAGLDRVLASLVQPVRDAYWSVLEDVSAFDAAQRAAFAPLALVPSYLTALARPGHRPLHDIATINPTRRFVKLWLAARFGRL